MTAARLLWHSPTGKKEARQNGKPRIGASSLQQRFQIGKIREKGVAQPKLAAEAFRFVAGFQKKVAQQSERRSVRNVEHRLKQKGRRALLAAAAGLNAGCYLRTSDVLGL